MKYALIDVDSEIEPYNINDVSCLKHMKHIQAQILAMQTDSVLVCPSLISRYATNNLFAIRLASGS